MSEEQVQESGVSTEGAPSPETPSPAESQTGASQQEAAGVNEQKDVPFHEHPRFKELVDQKNQYAEKYTQLEQMYKALEAKVQQQTPQPKKEPTTEDKILERLKGIDPEFAGFQQKLLEKVAAAESVQQELARMKADREAETANSTFERLCTENKVPKELQTFYRETVANMAMSKNAQLSQLPALFKEAHDRLSKSFEDFRRADREAYTKEKQKDKTPATQSGGSPAGSKTAEPISKEDVKARIAAALRNGATI